MYRKLLKIGLLLYGVYFVCTTIFLNAGPLYRLVNSNPNSLEIQYALAVSPFPGLVYLKKVKFWLQDDNIQLHFEMPTTWVLVNVFDLPKRKFHPLFVKGKDLSFRLRFLRAPQDFRPALIKTLPPIPGFPGFIKPFFAREEESSSDVWKVRIENVDIPTIRELWFEEFHFQGLAKVKGGFFISPGREVFVDPADLEILSGTVTLGKRKFIEDCKAKVDFEISKFDPEKESGMQPFNHVDATFSAQFPISEMRFLNYYLNQTPWLALKEGQGFFTAEIKIKKGEWQQGSKLNIDFSKVTSRLVKSEVSGTGKLKWEALKDQTQLSLLLSQYSFHSPEEPVSVIQGKEMHIEVDSPQMKIAAPLEKLTMRLKMQDAKIVNMEYYNLYIPESSDLRLIGGKGRLNADLELSTDPLHPDHGLVGFSAEKVRIRHKKDFYQGNLKLVGKLNQGKALEKGADVSGSILEITDLKLFNKSKQEGKAWWARVEIPQGKIKVNGNREWEGQVEMKAQNAKPFTHLLSEGIPSWVQNIFSFENLSIRMHVSMNSKKILLSEISASGDRGRLSGWFLQDGESKNASALLEYDPFSAGFFFENNKLKLRLENASEWFRKNDNPALISNLERTLHYKTHEQGE